MTYVFNLHVVYVVINAQFLSRPLVVGCYSFARIEQLVL